jgi:hypothetical protein
MLSSRAKSSVPVAGRHLAIWLLLCPLAGCATTASNYRDWSPDQAVLPYAEMGGDRVRVHNVRNCTYLSTRDYVVNYYDKTFNLDELSSVYFIMVPFPYMQSLGHTMLSFGFEGGDYLAVSVEVRKEKGEQYAIVGGFFNKYELMYVLGDEQDLIKLRTNYRNDDVYVYRANATPEQARDLFLDVMGRVNQLAAEPEFYNTLSNNCTTNIVDHINGLKPDRVPRDIRILLPGYSDRLAYDLGLIATDLPFDATKQRANVSRLARIYGDNPDFSDLIRR